MAKTRLSCHDSNKIQHNLFSSFFKLERKKNGPYLSTFFLVVFFPVMRLTGDEFRFLCVHPFVVISFFFYSKANGCTMTDRQHQIQEALSKGAFRLDLSCFNIQRKKKKLCRRMTHTHTQREGRDLYVSRYIYCRLDGNELKEKKKKRESHHHSEKRKKIFSTFTLWEKTKHFLSRPFKSFIDW